MDSKFEIGNGFATIGGVIFNWGIYNRNGNAQFWGHYTTFAKSYTTHYGLCVTPLTGNSSYTTASATNDNTLAGFNAWFGGAFDGWISNGFRWLCIGI